MAKRKTNKEDAGSTYGARGQKDQLRGAEERSTESGRMAPSSLEFAAKKRKKKTMQFVCCVIITFCRFCFSLQKITTASN